MTVQLRRSDVPLRLRDVRADAVTAAVLAKFDLAPDTVDLAFYPWVIEKVLPPSWSIGVIVGASGTGKSTLLRSLGGVTIPTWDLRCSIAGNFASAEEAADKLAAVGLNSVPTWAKPYGVLSTGEQFRASLARSLGDGARIDEYTSTVSRTVAKSASRSLRAWVDRSDTTNLVLATCHYDVLDWLRPDWVINTDSGTFTAEDTDTVAEEHWWTRFTEPSPAGSISMSRSTG